MRMRDAASLLVDARGADTALQPTPSDRLTVTKSPPEQEQWRWSGGFSGAASLNQLVTSLPKHAINQQLPGHRLGMCRLPWFASSTSGSPDSCAVILDFASTQRPSRRRWQAVSRVPAEQADPHRRHRPEVHRLRKNSGTEDERAPIAAPRWERGRSQFGTTRSARMIRSGAAVSAGFGWSLRRSG